MKTNVKILIPRQIILLLVISTGLLNHVILIPNLLSAAGRDSWFGTIIAFFISILFLFLLIYITKNCHPNGFFTYVKDKINKPVAYILSIPIILYLFFSVYITFRDLMIWLNAYFLSDTSIIAIILLLVISCMFVSLSGIKHMAIASGFILPLVVALGFMISLSNTSIKDPSLLFPILSEGWSPVWEAVMYSLSGLLEIFLILLLQPFLQERLKKRHFIISLCVFTVLILGPLTASIMEFGVNESIHFRYPAYEQWRVLSIGEYINHLDFFALFQWMSGALIRIGLFMFLIGTFFTKANKDYRISNRVILILYVFLFFIMLINIETRYFYQWVYNYFLPIFTVIIAVQILVSALLILVIKTRDKQHENNTPIHSNN